MNKQEQRYTLSVTESQLRLISRVLEFFCRIHLGQFGEIIHLFVKRNLKNDANHVLTATRMLEFAKYLLLELDEHAYFGIYSDEVEKEGKEAWNLHLDIRNRLAWDRHPDGGPDKGLQVDFDPPAWKYALDDHVPAVAKKEEGYYCRHCGLAIWYDTGEGVWRHMEHEGQACGSLSPDTVAEKTMKEVPT